MLDGLRHGVGEDVMGDLGHAWGGSWLPAAGNQRWLVPSLGMATCGKPGMQPWNGAAKGDLPLTLAMLAFQPQRKSQGLLHNKLAPGIENPLSSSKVIIALLETLDPLRR